MFAIECLFVTVENHCQVAFGGHVKIMCDDSGMCDDSECRILELEATTVFICVTTVACVTIAFAYA